MKKCPCCAEEIQDEAIKCKHCGEFLDGSTRPKSEEEAVPWYFGGTFIVIAVCCVGPLALPLLWGHPKMNRSWKIGLTIAILALTYVLYQATMESLAKLKDYDKLLRGM